MNQKKHNLFTSRWGFILSAVGSAVGMANVWGFPAKLGANGGGAFLVAYLIFIVLFSSVGLTAEYTVGRRFRTGAVGSYREIWRSRRRSARQVAFGAGCLWPVPCALLSATPSSLPMC